MINYNDGKGEFENWLITEDRFDPKYQGKCEAVMSLGNGYLGIRSATEEDYVGQTRNTFINGTFNKFDDYDVTELPNAADQIAIEVWIDGNRFSLDNGQVSDYRRTLNLLTGELSRSFIWTNIFGKAFKFDIKRFVSFTDLHLFGTKMSITSLNQSANIEIRSGINGQVTNSGAQHFHEGEKQVLEGKFLQMVQTTTESKVDFVHNSVHSILTSESDIKTSNRFEIKRRRVRMLYTFELGKDQDCTIEKVSNIFTTRDKENDGLSLAQIRKSSFDHLQKALSLGYDNLAAESSTHLKDKYKELDIKIESDNAFDQLALRFAIFHLAVATPAHDNRCGIGAKGLSGEGYKGHSFWDTEIFMLPYFTFTQPEVAQSLLEYRYFTLPGARQKATKNGYKGAMYPWESAWAEDGEVTPVWGDADVISGEAMKIWSGFIEQHITSDVAFAVWQYYMTTGDEKFMENYGYEILLDTGIFWSSRLEWNEEKNEYHINEVIGPDEYKEHVNNDAFTNYTAKWCMENAIRYSEYLKNDKHDIYERLNTKLNLDSEIRELKSRYDNVFIPQPNSSHVIPQDDNFLNLKQIDLSKYKNQEHVGSIFLDYNLDQINKIQVCKQASVVMLMYLLEHKFNKDTKNANYKYYEPLTLHDSSLSLSTHAVLAADIGDKDLAYSLFQKAIRIDLGPNMKSSDHGLHTASLGGIWQIIVFGFGGVRMVGGELRISPNLPKGISNLEFQIIWQGEKLQIGITKEKLTITPTNLHATIECEVFGDKVSITEERHFNY